MPKTTEKEIRDMIEDVARSVYATAVQDVAERVAIAVNRDISKLPILIAVGGSVMMEVAAIDMCVQLRRVWENSDSKDSEIAFDTLIATAMDHHMTAFKRTVENTVVALRDMEEEDERLHKAP